MAVSRQLLDALAPPIAAARDKVILLVGFAGGLRESELAAIEIRHLGWHAKGVTIKIERSKTDQEGAGREVEIPFGLHPETCPAAAIRHWMAISGIASGFLLRRVDAFGNIGKTKLHPTSIGCIVQRLAARAGFARPKDYAGHSLRAGFVTEASANGAMDRQIMRQTGHKSRAMIDRYSRQERCDRQAAASKLGL